MKVNWRLIPLTVITVTVAALLAGCPLPFDYNGQGAGSANATDPSSPKNTVPVVVAYSEDGGTSGTITDGTTYTTGLTTTVTLSTTTENAIIYYTDDGTELTKLDKATRIGATHGEITIARSTTVQTLDIHAVAIGPNMHPSPAVHVVVSVSPYPILSVSRDRATASEDGGTATFTISSTGSSASDITVNLKTGGDFTSANLTGLPNAGTTFTATLVHGTTKISLPITGVHDSDALNQTATLTVLPDTATPTTYTVASPSSASVTIQDDMTPVLTITPNVASLTDNGGSSGFTLTSSFAMPSGLVVNLQTSGTYWAGELTGGIPASGATFAVTLPAGATTLVIPFVTHPDPGEFNNETVTLSLVASSTYTNGSPASATITITDSSPIPVLTLTEDRSSMVDGQTATFTVHASVAPDAPHTVSISSSGYTAGQVVVPATVVIPSGATSATFPVSAPSTVGYALQNPQVTLLAGVGHTLGSPVTQGLQITDDTMGSFTYDGTWGFGAGTGSAVGSGAGWTVSGNVTLGSGGLTFGGTYPTDDATVPLSGGSTTFTNSLFTLGVQFVLGDTSVVHPIIAAGTGYRWLIIQTDSTGALTVELNNHSVSLPTGMFLGAGSTYTMVAEFDLGAHTITLQVNASVVTLTIPSGFSWNYPPYDELLTANDYSQGHAFKGTWNWVFVANGFLSYNSVVQIAGAQGL